jgi:hypothetical protein
VTYRLNDWRNGQLGEALESLDSEGQSLLRTTTKETRVPTPLPPPPFKCRENQLSGSEEAEALADTLGAQFQPVDDRSDPALTEMFGEAMCAHKYELQVNRHQLNSRWSHRPSRDSR